MTHMLYGIMGGTVGYQTNQQQITEDNDGRFTTSYCNGHIDLTHILSRALGKQMSQMGTYRVNYLQISLRNVDDSVDNDSAIVAGGNIRYYAPTKHRINALQLARAYKKANEEGTLSSDPFATFSNDKNYRGLRFGLASDSDISGGTSDGTSALSGTNFSMNPVFQAYDLMLGDEGYDSSGEGQKLWVTRTGAGVMEGLQFCTTFTNRGISNGGATFNDYEFFDPDARVWQWTAPPGGAIDVLGGILRIDLTHGNTDAPGVTEDEYEMLVTVGVEGWSEF